MLAGAGCLPAGDWRTGALVGGSDVVGALAGREPGAPPVYDDATRAAVVDATMSARGTFATPRWTQTHDLATHRGLLGEALRRADVEASLTAGQQVVQGILVVHAPPELWNATQETARAWAEANGIPSAHLYRHVDETGAARWGRLLTEIDVAVMESLPDGRLRPVRFENVKAGVGSAPAARKQNNLARDNWADPNFHFLLPGGPRRYHEPPLDRTAAAQAALGAVTVGPSDDPRYDAALPLSSNDITVMSLNHGG
jgi:hypothetical protein